mgnify:CR=1 FL=1
MIGYVVLVVLGILVFGFVLQPLLSGRSERIVSTPERIADLRARRAYLLEAIRDVDFDHDAGKVSEEEYTEASGRFVHEAALVLRELDQLTGQVEQEIEQEIAQLRQAARAGSTRETGRSTSRL